MTVVALTLPSMATDSPGTADPLRSVALLAREGESAAFSRLYEETRDLAWRVLYRVVGNSSDLEDLLQESYLQLMRALRTYRGEARVTTFVHRVCVNVGLMHLRTRRRRPEEPTEELPEAASDRGDPERAAQVSQAARMVQRALASLSREKAEVFVYHELLGLRPEEISELVGCPANTVRSRLNRARTDFTGAVAELTRGAP